MDDCNWSEDRWNQIRTQVIPYLEECGYNTNSDVYWIPISGIHGDNIKTKSKNATWYNGPTLIDLFDQMEIP